MVDIDEPVGVVASFYQGRIRPLSFRWEERLIRIRRVTYEWSRRDGLRMIYFFSVTDGKTLYNLVYETDTLTWRLQAVETEGWV